MPPAGPTFRIERIVAGGLGLARDGGRVVLVERAAPGDVVEVVVVSAHRTWQRARIARLVESGPGRREPPCPHALRCGGCPLQHLDYEAQLAAKEDILRESLTRIGRIAAPAAVAVHRSPEWGWRRRARFHLARGRGGPVRIGLRGWDGREVVAIGPCPVLTPRLEAGLDALRAEAGSRREIEAFDGDGEVVAGDRETVVTVGEDRLRAAPTAFFQANAALAGALRDRVVERAAAAGGEGTALDLFAGVGLFTLPLARRFAEVVAVEGQATSARLLAANVAGAGLEGVRVERADVAAWLAGPAAPRGAVVVADPPRQGLGPRLVEGMAALAPRRIVLVACDPAALGRDAGGFVAAGFALASVDLFDLFPHTPHFESVAVLVPAPEGAGGLLS